MFRHMSARVSMTTYNLTDLWAPGRQRLCHVHICIHQSIPLTWDKQNMNYLVRVFPLVQSLSLLGGHYINIFPPRFLCILLNIRVIGKSNCSTIVQRQGRWQHPHADTRREVSIAVFFGFASVVTLWLQISSQKLFVILGTSQGPCPDCTLQERSYYLFCSLVYSQHLLCTRNPVTKLIPVNWLKKKKTLVWSHKTAKC